ncbi:DUF6090 family protein [Aestuariivivens sediminicola]|uniref:DUF6090 family protein n=1 Tax=Aestuariivivens sediminicola TaxID=2913560 RepID=UPI001F56F066|nr:DUF6090 family protein [Aestuariivivens sediminicola]
MIKFFRRIRQRLLAENNFSKYLIYAIGEIILVVIGILIALQVNNWNENRKRNANELEYLKRLNEDIKVSIEKTRLYTDFMINTANRSTKIIDNLNNCLIPETDQKNFVNGMYHLGKLAPPVVIRGTINELQSTGNLLSIQNVDLRKQLTKMLGVYEEFNVIFSQAEGFVAPHVYYIDEKFSFNIEVPTRGNTELDYEDAIFDLDELCKDSKFIAAVLAIRNYTFDVANWNELTLQELEIFKKSIEQELLSKEK